MGFEPLARTALPPAHFGYLATGVDGDLTVARNADAFLHYEIRARRFADLTHLDTSRMVLGTRWASPLYLSAVSSQRAFHPEGELAMARAAHARGADDALDRALLPGRGGRGGLGRAPWQQLYATDDFAVTAAIVRRAEQAGTTAIVLTVDSADPATQQRDAARAMRADSRICGGLPRRATRMTCGMGADVRRTGHLARDGARPAGLTAVFLDRLRQLVTGRLMVKGIVTGEDAALAWPTAWMASWFQPRRPRRGDPAPSIDCVPEVVAAVQGKVPVFVDGGIRRGTDVFKALALGATAVGIGRPQAWGLAAFGQPGVERVIDIYTAELPRSCARPVRRALADITGRTCSAPEGRAACGARSRYRM